MAEMKNYILDPLFLEKAVQEAVMERIKNNVKDLLMEEIDRIIEEVMVEVKKSLHVILHKERNVLSTYETIIIKAFYNEKELVEAS